MRPEKWRPGLAQKILRMAQKRFFEPLLAYDSILLSAHDVPTPAGTQTQLMCSAVYTSAAAAIVFKTFRSITHWESTWTTRNKES